MGVVDDQGRVSIPSGRAFVITGRLHFKSHTYAHEMGSYFKFIAALWTWCLWAVGPAEIAAGAPAFAKTQLDSKFRSEGVALGDFNEDGALDIAAGNVWYQAPSWQMHPIRSAALEFDPLSFSDSFANFVDDINGDGWDDLIVVGFPGGPTTWYENPKNTALPWAAHQAVAVTNNESPAYVDVDGDSRRELVFGHSPDGNPNSSQRRLAIAQPGPDPTQPWDVRTISADAGPGSGQFSHGLGVGDMNLDGRKDVVTPQGWYEAPLSTAQAAWTFHALRLGLDAGQMHVYDFDGDGDQDVLSSSAHDYGIWWHERRQTGSITHEIFDGFSQSHSLEIADLDANGLPDFVTGKRRFAHPPPGDPGTFEPSVLYWFELTRTGGIPSWTPHEIDAASGVGTQFQIADVNGDGLRDIVTANKNGVFLFQQESSGDFDADGDVDGQDFLVWQREFGTSGPGHPADGNKDGVVDAADFVVWSDDFGSLANSQMLAAPEGRTATLLVVGAAMGSGTLRRFARVPVI